MSKRYVQTFYPNAHTEKIYTEVFPEQRLNFDDSGEASVAVDFILEEGQHYVVCFDRVNYELDASNGALANNLFSIFADGEQMTVRVASAGTHTVRLTVCEEVVKKIEGKYLPEIEGKYLPEGTPWVKETIEEVYPKTTLTIFDGFYNIPQPFAFEIGERFIVTINGVDYDASVVDGESVGGGPDPVLINDGGSFANPANTEFVIGTTPDVEGVVVFPFKATQAPKPFDLTVHKINATIQPVDPRCIVLTAPNGAQYNLAVADDGTLSAVEI